MRKRQTIRRTSCSRVWRLFGREEAASFLEPFKSAIRRRLQWGLTDGAGAKAASRTKGGFKRTLAPSSVPSKGVTI